VVKYRIEACFSHQLDDLDQAIAKDQTQRASRERLSAPIRPQDVRQHIRAAGRGVVEREKQPPGHHNLANLDSEGDGDRLVCVQYTDIVACCPFLCLMGDPPITFVGRAR
jgi:hypothetical protein